MHALTTWSNYYVITGSSSGALTGLMFVVITLVAGQERAEYHARDGVETFSSPTVVHFCTALLVSAILSAPWNSLLGPSIMLALTGLYGVVYAVRVLLRMIRMRQAYTPTSDDWFWYAIAPMVTYAVTLLAAILLAIVPTQALFALAACTIALIFLGIRNAWDVVTFLAIAAGDKSTRPSTFERRTP
jgi:hypothetical protein